MRWIVPLVLGSVFALSAPALAGPVDDVEPTLDALLSAREDANDRRAARTLSRVARQLDRARDRDLGYPQQVRTLIAVARQADRKFADEQALVDALVSAADAIEGDLVNAQDVLDALVAGVEAGTVDLSQFSKRRRLSLRSLKKIQRSAVLALSRAADAADSTRNPLSKRYMQLSRAAAALDGYRDQGGLTASWVITTVRIANSLDAAVDLDGDGMGDNQVANIVSVAQLLGVNVDETIAELFNQVDPDAGNPIAPVIQMWGFDEFDTDPIVFAGLLTAIDTDGNTADNDSGSETLTAPEGSLEDDGHPVLRTVSQFSAGGAYSFLADGTGLSLAGLEFPAGAPFGITGIASATSNNGVIGFAVSTEQVLMLLEGQIDGGLGESAAAFIRTLTDIDTDGDKVPDSLSFALAFEGAPCLLVDDK